MNQETEKAQDKPVLNAESFQRLLAAAYLLQVHIDRRPSAQPIGAGHKSPFVAGAIVQKRTLSVRQVPPVGPTVLHRMSILLRRPTSWRTVEALAIGFVLCMMMGLSIHRLSALPGRTLLPSGKREQRNASQPSRPTEKVLASSQQPVVTRNSRQSPDGGHADIVAEDIVIGYQKPAANLLGQAAKKPLQAQLLPPKNTTSKPGVRSALSRDADMLAGDTLVQYGADVTVWSGNPKRSELDRLGH